MKIYRRRLDSGRGGFNLLIIWGTDAVEAVDLKGLSIAVETGDKGKEELFPN
jgi:hypothetical protein